MASRTDSPTYHFSNKKKKNKKQKTNVYVAVAHSSLMAQHVSSLILASEHPALPLITMVSSLSYSDPVVIFVTQLYKKKKVIIFIQIPLNLGLECYNSATSSPYIAEAVTDYFFFFYFLGFGGVFFFNYHIELTLSFLL